MGFRSPIPSSSLLPFLVPLASPASHMHALADAGLCSDSRLTARSAHSSSAQGGDSPAELPQGESVLTGARRLCRTCERAPVCSARLFVACCAASAVQSRAASQFHSRSRGQQLNALSLRPRCSPTNTSACCSHLRVNRRPAYLFFQPCHLDNKSL